MTDSSWSLATIDGRMQRCAVGGKTMDQRVRPSRHLAVYAASTLSPWKAVPKALISDFFLINAIKQFWLEFLWLCFPANIILSRIIECASVRHRSPSHLFHKSLPHRSECPDGPFGQPDSPRGRLDPPQGRTRRVCSSSQPTEVTRWPFHFLNPQKNFVRSTSDTWACCLRELMEIGWGLSVNELK